MVKIDSFPFSLQGIADAGIALTILTAFCFIPAGYTIYLVKEQVNGEKQLQHLCGVGIVLYWINAIFWDLVCVFHHLPIYHDIHLYLCNDCVRY